jgi:hypothetical protein
MPLSASSASTTATSSGSSSARTSGAVLDCASRLSLRTSNGQQKASSPVADAIASAAAERVRTRTTRCRAPVATGGSCVDALIRPPAQPRPEPP